MVFNWKLVFYIKRSARDGSSFAIRMLIGVNWLKVVRIGTWPFADGPSIISAADTLIDFFPSIITHIIDVHSVCSGLECECEWIAQAKRPNLFFGSHGVIIWIVSRYRAIRIDSKDFSQACCKRLRVVGDIVVASCNVQLAIISKMNRSCVMSGST